MSSFRLSVAEVKAAASGNWISILASAGIDQDALDRREKPCPKCGGDTRFRALNDFDETGAIFCSHCFFEKNGDGLAAIQWWRDCSFSEALEYVAGQLGIVATSHTAITRTPQPVRPQEDSDKRRYPGAIRAALDYDAGRDSEELLLQWAARTGVPLAGLQRTKVRVGLTSRHDSERLIIPEPIRMAKDWSHLAGTYSRRYDDNSKKGYKGAPRGCSMWGHSRIVHNVEGWRDHATLAAAGVTSISKASADSNVTEVAYVGADAVQLIVWGEHDGGKGKAEKYAQKISELISTPVRIIVVYPPADCSDVHDMYVRWCTRRKVDPVGISKANLKAFGEWIQRYVDDHGRELKREDREEADRRNRHYELAIGYYEDAREIIAKTRCGSKSVVYGYVTKQDGSKQDGGMSPRCCRSIACQNCKQIHQLFTMAKWNLRLVDFPDSPLYAYQCDESEADKVLDKLEYQRKQECRSKGVFNARLYDGETRTRDIVSNVLRDDLKPTELSSLAASELIDTLVGAATCEPPEGVKRFQRFWLAGQWKMSDRELHDRLGDADRGKFTAVGTCCRSLYFEVAKEKGLEIHSERLNGKHPNIVEWHTAGLADVKAIDAFNAELSERQEEIRVRNAILDAAVESQMRAKREREFRLLPIGTDGYYSIGNNRNLAACVPAGLPLDYRGAPTDDH